MLYSKSVSTSDWWTQNEDKYALAIKCILLHGCDKCTFEELYRSKSGKTTINRWCCFVDIEFTPAYVVSMPNPEEGMITKIIRSVKHGCLYLLPYSTLFLPSTMLYANRT
jgi:hypothetical protein